MLFLSCFAGSYAQQTDIRVNGHGQSLSQTLEQLAHKNQLHFAYDANYFSALKVQEDIEARNLAEFIQTICKKYHLKAEDIDGTVVLYPNPEPLPPPVIEKRTFSAVVIDQTSGEPLRYCNIGLQGTNNYGTTTNELGIFSTTTNGNNEIQIAISHLGYQRLDTIITIGREDRHIIRLRPFTVQMATIQVTQQEKDVVEMGNQTERIAFNPKQSANFPQVDNSDLISSLHLIPGIHFIGGQSSGISIRGSYPSENLIALDGIPLLETSHLFGNLSVLNSKFVSQAFVSRGAFDATYGEKISGIVELTGQTNFYKPSFELSANLLNVSATANIPVTQKLSFSGAFRRSYIDRWENYLYRSILNQASTNDEASVSPVIRFDDLNLKIALKPSDKHQISVNFINSTDFQERDYIFKDQSRLYRYEHADSNNKGFSANWAFQPGEDFQQRLTIGYNELQRSTFKNAGMSENSQGKGAKDELDTDHNFLKEFSASWSGELHSQRFTHQAGFGVNTYDVSYDYLTNKSTGTKLMDSIIFDNQTAVVHAYFQEKLRLTPLLQARIGLRANYLGQNQQLYWQPRAGLTYELNKKMKLVYAGGLYYQFLSRIRKIDIDNNVDLVWYLPAEEGQGILKAWQNLIGFQYNYNGLSMNVEAYWKNTSGRANLYAQQSSGKEKIIDYFLRSGRSINRGIDLMIQYRHGKFTHIIGSTISESNEQFEGYYNSQYYPSFYDQRFKIRWSELCKMNNWLFSANLFFHSGSPYLTNNEQTADQLYERLPHFMQIDLAVQRRFQLKFCTFNLGFSCMNVLDRKNVLEIDYFNISNNTGSYAVRTDITAIQFTPVFFVNVLLK